MTTHFFLSCGAFGTSRYFGPVCVFLEREREREGEGEGEGEGGREGGRERGREGEEMKTELYSHIK